MRTNLGAPGLTARLTTVLAQKFSTMITAIFRAPKKAEPLEKMLIQVVQKTLFMREALTSVSTRIC